MTYVDGSKYEGMFERGLREGLGVFTAVDGSVFEGNWQGNH
jgi:hypothetical protein